jgi:tRNA A-37 threonylcarbamoyl transferase component Bud32
VAILLCLVLGTSAQADKATVTIEVFPPEAKIQAFLPGSPPKEGDVVANGGPFQVRDTINFPLRLSAPGYSNREVDVALVKVHAVAPGEWRFHYELEPQGLVSIIKHEFRKYPVRSYGAILALMGAGLVAALTLRRHLATGTVASKAALKAAEEEAVEARERLLEVDPELVGRTIDNYEVLGLAGEGAFAKVYKARHTEYHDIFALKVLRADLLDQSVGERVEREMVIGRDLIHPYLVRVFGFGTFREAPYLVLEFVEGVPLDERLAEGPMGLREALRVVKKIAEGLQFAHGKGVIHRDLKPANLFLTPGGGVKILDFGVAKILDSEQRLTLTGQALGTPHYMSPEQARGLAGVGSDVYALAAIAFEMMTGSPPFDGDTALEVLTAHTFSEVPSVRELNPDVPEKLDDLLRTMLAKSQADRPASMVEVIRRLDEVSL